MGTGNMIIYVLAPACATVVFVRGKIFDAPKVWVIDHINHKYPSFLLKALFSCPLCLGFWCGVIRYILGGGSRLDVGTGQFGSLLGMLSSGVIVSVVSKILDCIAYPANR